MSEQPTQVRHPNRAAIRTAFQAAVALATLIPYVVAEGHIPIAGGAAQVVAVAAGVTRVMALPGVADWLQRFVPWLAPTGGIRTPPDTPEPSPGHGEGSAVLSD